MARLTALLLAGFSLLGLVSKCVFTIGVVLVSALAANAYAEISPETSLDTSVASPFVKGWDARWKYDKNQGYCCMSLRAGVYGEARFVARADEPLNFELQARRDLQGGRMSIWKHAPAWHPKRQPDVNLGQLMHLVGAGSVTHGQTADQMLLALRDGYEIILKSASQVEDPARLKWRLPSLGFAAALDDFLSCARTQSSVSWQQISRSRVMYETDEHRLNEQALARLKMIGAYVRQDSSITAIYVDGHTDNSGTEKSNYQLSKKRAETAVAYLKADGLEHIQYVVRYHGAAYPVADNGDVAGRTSNRRTTVRLQRTD